MPPQQTDLTAEAERDAAGLGLDLPIPPTRSVPGLLERCWLAFQERRRRQGLRTALHELSDRELMDIGLTRAEIDYITPQRAIETLRDSTRYLLIRGGM
jgi:uncharacterized protein YjiS (DUF1127 family)